MSSFTFLSQNYLAWLLCGVVAPPIPLLIHLSRSRRTKKMRFSTTRFFTDQFLRSYRMSRLKEVFLLLFRMALFALLAMALAQPFLAPPGTVAAGGTGSGPRVAILVLDDSASMGLAEGEVTLFAKAQKSADSILAGLAGGSTASVILAGRRAPGPEVLFPEPTPDLDDGEGDHRQASGGGAGDGPLGRDHPPPRSSPWMLGSDGRRSATIYVLSDLQESGWDAPTDNAEGR